LENKAFDTPYIDTSSKALFVTAPICTKLMITKKYYIEISLMEFHTSCSGRVRITDRNSFTLLSKTCHCIDFHGTHVWSVDCDLKEFMHRIL